MVNSDTISTQENISELDSEISSESINSEIAREEKVSISDEEVSSNGLENFEIKDDVPELFSSENNEVKMTN